ncbi:MAG: hypothetical protein IJR59_06810 [Firmicutes bacterium]|nr:hypothetical protein [Bacillota bacterium]
MTGEEFVKLCYTEKATLLSEYFNIESNTFTSEIIRRLKADGTDNETLKQLVDSVMTNVFYTMLLGLDGAASLGCKQISYKLYDEDNNLLNKCGELEENAYNYFIDKEEEKC